MAKNSMIPRTIIKQTLAASAVCVALCAPALAEGEMPDSEHGRYTFNKVADGFPAARHPDRPGIGLQPAHGRLRLPDGAGRSHGA